MTMPFTKSALKRHPAFVISESERAVDAGPEHPAVLNLLQRSLEEIEGIGKNLDRLSLTQESISRELATLAQRAPQSDFHELRSHLAEDYIPVMDALHRLARALSGASNGSAEVAAVLSPLAEGSRLVEEKGVAYLESLGVQAIPSVGEVFDKCLHEAVGTREVSQEQEGFIVEETVRGYRMGAKVLRSAQVIVGRGSQEKAAPA